MDAAMEKRLLLLNEATRCCCSDDEYMKNISSVQAVLKRFLPDILVVLLFAVIAFAYFFPADTEGRKT